MSLSILYVADAGSGAATLAAPAPPDAAAPGSAARIVVRLADVAAFGDLDGTGGLDAAVVLIGSGGGSGTFVELAAVLNDAGAARPVATTLLGDRILVREVTVQDRTIV